MEMNEATPATMSAMSRPTMAKNSVRLCLRATSRTRPSSVMSTTTTVTLSPPACGERGVDQVVRADLRGGALLGDALDLAVWDHARHAIGAQDEAVALLDVQGEMVGVHRRIGAQGSRDDGPVGMRARLVGGDLAGIDELLDVGVIARDADEGALV